jgi:hypothetical protein
MLGSDGSPQGGPTMTCSLASLRCNRQPRPQYPRLSAIFDAWASKPRRSAAASTPRADGASRAVVAPRRAASLRVGPSEENAAICSKDMPVDAFRSRSAAVTPLLLPSSPGTC